MDLKKGNKNEFYINAASRPVPPYPFNIPNSCRFGLNWDPYSPGKAVLSSLVYM
jgi:hypothetical protein